MKIVNFGVQNGPPKRSPDALKDVFLTRKDATRRRPFVAKRALETFFNAVKHRQMLEEHPAGSEAHHDRLREQSVSKTCPVTAEDIENSPIHQDHPLILPRDQQGKELATTHESQVYLSFNDWMEQGQGKGLSEAEKESLKHCTETGDDPIMPKYRMSKKENSNIFTGETPAEKMKREVKEMKEKMKREVKEIKNDKDLSWEQKGEKICEVTRDDPNTYLATRTQYWCT